MSLPNSFATEAIGFNERGVSTLQRDVDANVRRSSSFPAHYYSCVANMIQYLGLEQCEKNEQFRWWRITGRAAIPHARNLLRWRG